MRIVALALTGLLAMSLASSAVAQRRAPSHEACQRMAAENSLVPGQHGYTEFMRECTTGRVGSYSPPRN